MTDSRSRPQAKSARTGRPWSREGLVALLLLVATVVAYWPAMRGTYLWDDDDHISTNQTLRSLHGLWEIWFQPGATPQYYPMSFTGFWAGYHLWGLNPLGYHLLNVLMHGVVALLLWQVLARLQVRGAWLAGAIFALHPVCVMSAAWMTELKNTLSAALALGAGWAYLRFARLGVYEAAGTRSSGADQAGQGRAWWFYALSVGLFQLALFAKTAVSFLPVTLLLVTWWRRDRLRWREVWPLVPMLGLVVAISQMTFYIEQLHGATGETFNLGFGERVLISGRSFWFYLGKLFLPHHLTFIYERWHVDTGLWWQYLFPLATAGALLGLWWGRRRLGKGLLVAFLHFYVCTSLLILLTVLYMTRFTFVSDHWQYFGCMSVIALVAAGITSALGRFEQGRPFLKPASCGLLLLVLGVLTWEQSHIYVDQDTLWQDTLAKNPGCWMADYNLGETLLHQGDRDGAIAHFQAAVQLKPDYFEAQNNLGSALRERGEVDEAIPHFQAALQINPDYAGAHYNLALALLQKGRVDEAIAHLQSTVQIDASFAQAYQTLGSVLLRKGRMEEAISYYERAVQANPDFTEAQNNLAWVLATCPQASLRNGKEAVALAERANQLSGGENPVVLRTLAAAYAEAGRFPEAVATAQRAVELAEAHSSTGLANAIRAQMKFYQAGVPFHLN